MDGDEDTTIGELIEILQSYPRNYTIAAHDYNGTLIIYNERGVIHTEFGI
jgi:hypothetical protein